MKPQAKTILLTAVLGVIWAGAIAVGLRPLLSYEISPGRVGAIPRFWPANSRIQPADDRPTLVMLAHPQCPCTRASMAELAQVMARIEGKIRGYVLFYVPSAMTSTWDNTELRRTASQIPGVTVLSDLNGVEARRFGAETSGHTFLFDSAGHLLFNGGITASRGHSGDNVGERAIISIVNHTTAPAETFVFGCSFSDREKAGIGAACLR